MSRDTILTQLAESALRGVVDGLEECAAIYGRDRTLTLGTVIELLTAVLDEGITSPGQHLHSVKA